METLVLLKIRTQLKHLQNQAGVLLLVDRMRFQLVKAESKQFPPKFYFRVKTALEVCGPGCWLHRLEGGGKKINPKPSCYFLSKSCQHKITANTLSIQTQHQGPAGISPIEQSIFPFQMGLILFL